MVSATPAGGCRLRGGVEVAGKSAGFDLLQIFLPEFVAMQAEIVKEVPGIDAAIVPVAEDQPQRIGADGLDALDADIAFSGLQRLLPGPMPAGLGRRGEDPQKFAGELETF